MRQNNAIVGTTSGAKLETNHQTASIDARRTGRGNSNARFFRPSVAELGPVPIHARADGIPTVSEKYSEPGSPKSLGQRDIFQNLSGDGRVATDSVVGRPLYQYVLPVGCNNAGVLITHASRRILCGQFRENDRHDDSLGEADNDLLGRVGQQIGFLFFRFLDCASE